MSENSDSQSDCYSAGERGWMEYGQRVRAFLLGPLLICLNRLNVTPDGITLVAGLIGLGFIPLWLTGHATAALACLFTHVLLDGLDGPLARFQEVESSRGSFTDTFADQLVVTGVMIAWMVASPSSLNIVAGSVYIFFYTMVVAMAMVRNAIEIPYSWLIRPRFLVYVTIAIDVWSGRHFTLVVLVVCDVLLAVKTISGFLKLRGRLPGPDAQ